MQLNGSKPAFAFVQITGAKRSLPVSGGELPPEPPSPLGRHGVGDAVTPIRARTWHQAAARPALLLGLPQHGATDPVSIDLQGERAELDG